MDELIHIWHTALSLPSLPYTIMLALSLAYWGLIILGALDLDTLMPVLDLDGDVDLDSGNLGGGLLESIGIGAMPITIPLSLISFLAWTTSMAAELYLAPHIIAFVPAALLTGGILVVAFVVGVACTRLAVIPLKPAFRVHTVHGQAYLIGKRVVVTSGTVGTDHGTAKMETGGAELLLNVRCEARHELAKHHEAVIIDYDETDNIYRIAPLQEP